MNYLAYQNLGRLSSCRLLYPLMIKKPQTILKTLNYSNSYHLFQSRKFSWTGFYSALSQSTPVVTVQNLLIEVHQISGLPWWAVIFLSTLGIRSIIVFPLTIHQHQVISRLANLNAGMGKIAEELNKEVNVAKKLFNWTEDQSKKVFRKQLKKIHGEQVIHENCHPFKSVLLVLIQIPIWICFSISLRNLTMASNAFNPGVDFIKLNFETEGVLWFTDLTVPDPIFIPLLLAFVNLSLIEIHAFRHIGKMSLPQKILINGSRLITIIVAAAATVNPASVTFYWLCSSTLGIGQILLLMVPRVRKLFRIPRIGKESPTPFTDMANNLKKHIK